jgi:hypothetical protein
VRLTVKVATAFEASPSAIVTSLIDRAMTLPLFRGVGAALVKSALLLSVSTWPPPFLMAAVVLPVPGAGAEPSKRLAPEPHPTRSRIVAI